MRKMILGDINMPLNHICEQLEFKHTYALWLPLLTLPCFLPFILHPDSTTPSNLACPLSAFFFLSSFSSRISRLSCSHPIMECFPEDLTL